MSPSIVFELEEPTGVRRQRWPVTRGVPFPRGALDGTRHLRLLNNEEGHEVPLQVKCLSTWPDGSVRWVLLHFQADLEPQSLVRYVLEYGPGIERTDVPSGVQITQADDRVILDTGPLRVALSVEAGLALLDQVWLDGQPMLVPGDQSGFVLEDARGCSYSSRWGRVTSLVVEEAGPLRAVILLTGDHRSRTGDRLFGYEVRLYAHAHLPWLEVEYTFVNDEDPLDTEIQRIGFHVKPDLGPAAQGLCGAYGDLYESSGPFCIYADTPANFGIFGGSRIYDSEGQLVEREDAGELSHKIAHGWMDLSDERGGLTVAVKRMAQLYPKRISVIGDALQVDLWPAEAGLLRWHQGMARTHRIFLLFHHGTGHEAAVNQESTCYEDDLTLWAPDWYPRSGALGRLFAYQPDRYPYIEMVLRDEFNLWRNQNQALGFLDYGDHPQWGQFEREQYMANNEIDLGHALALQYARVGERAYYEALEAIAWHTMDVDVVHHTTFDPVELGGARIHGNGHVQYNCEGISGVSVAPSHMWTEGLLEYYYLSGHPRALEIARGIGDCLLRMLDRGWAMPPYPVAWHGARDSGWVLIALTALYEATGEEKWLEGGREIVDALLAAQGEDGGWGLRIGWYRGLSALHLGIALTGLSHFHRLTGEERVRACLIRAADAMLEHCSFPDGGMTYVTAIGHRSNYYSGTGFESLGYAWHLTGDIRYLQAGWVGHRHALGAWGVTGIVHGTPRWVTSLTGTTLADWWRGNLRYMYWADQAGLLTDLPV